MAAAEPRHRQGLPAQGCRRRRRIINELPANQRRLLITDGVFSMDGDLGPLPALCDLAEAPAAS
jgi:7-keto-8-aminopelargonate synthetase-like enzyme